MRNQVFSALIQVMFISSIVTANRKSRGHIIIIGGGGGSKSVEEKVVHVPVPVHMPCPMHKMIQKVPHYIKVP